jgi:hypothetical protein
MFYSLKDLLSLHEYGSAIFNKGVILKEYEHRYTACKDKILWACCTYETSFFIHLRIPSESEYCKDVYYDVVFEFYPSRKIDITNGNLNDYGIKLFSNSTSFMFTYTYAYNKYNLIIPWLKTKCSKRCLIEPAVRKNPRSIIGTDAITWIAAYFISRTGLLGKSRFITHINTSVDHIKRVVFNQDQMLKIRNDTEENAKRLERAHNEVKIRQYHRKEEHAATKQLEKALERHARATKTPIHPRTAAKRIIKAARKAKLPR